MYTYWFWVKIVTLAFGPKMVIFDGWGMATWPSRWVRPHLPSPGEEKQDLPPFVMELLVFLWLCLFSHLTWYKTTGNGATTGLLFVGLLQ